MDKQKLQYVDEVLKEHLKENQPSTMTDVARLIQVSQMCHQRVSAKEKKQSKWQSNILAKIEDLKKKAQCIKKMGEKENLEPKEKTLMAKIFKSLGLPKYKKRTGTQPSHSSKKR